MNFTKTWAGIVLAAIVMGDAGASASALEQNAPAVTQQGSSGRPPDQVSMSTYSWGKVISEWMLRPDGSGRFTSTRQLSNSFNDYAIVTRRLDAAPGRFDQIGALLREAEPYAGKELPCRLAFTDGPYGEVTWVHDGVTDTLGVQYACRSPEADRVYDQLNAAQALVEKWAAQAPIMDERKPDSSR